MGFVDLLMNRLTKLFINNEILANVCLIASTICIIYVIPINKEYSVSFFVLLWFVASIIKEFNDADSS